MQILLFSGFGEDRMTAEMAKIIEKSKEKGDPLPKTRNKLAKYVEEHTDGKKDLYTMSREETRQYLIKNKETFLRSGTGTIALMDANDGLHIGPISTVDVDTSRKWCIRRDDGSEYVHYLEMPKCADKKTNFYVEEN